MEKYYRRSSEGALEYWEYWALPEGGFTVHQGRVGETGVAEDVAGPMDASIEAKRREGFAPIDIDDHHLIVVEYKIDGFGVAGDLEKRHALEEHLNETLGWTGLGQCDGGDIGSGMMAVFSFVVDYDIAERVLIADLESTPFADYARIGRDPSPPS